MKKLLPILILILALCACSAPTASPAPTPANIDPVGNPEALANPASVFCQESGNRLEIRAGGDGSQIGYCSFPDGSECEEWAFYRGECQPAATQVTPAPTQPAPESETSTASDGCSIYHSTELGYSFHYPADAQIVQNDDPLNGISIVGPVKDGESWPAISISHPADREEYRPPEDSDLYQWLSDHNLLGEERKPDTKIAGLTAIHFRHESSPQSPADDRYFFARGGQLYSIIIGHPGGREDWFLYDHFLESFTFDQDLPRSSIVTAHPTALPIDPSGYQGWWTYTHARYGFSIMLPEDWVVDETTTFDPVVGGHTLILHPEKTVEKESIRMTFRRSGEETLLWPTGVGGGEFVNQGTLDVAGEPAQRIALVCPAGEITQIWYHDGGGQPNITRGSLEFGFIFSVGGFCETGVSLEGKNQRVGEMIIASLKVL